MKRFGLIITLAGILSGCVSTVQDSIVAVPDWFESRRSELSDQGYPSIHEANKLESERNLAPWDQIRKDLEVSQAEINDFDAGPAVTTEAEMRAWAAEQRRLVAKGQEPY